MKPALAILAAVLLLAGCGHTSKPSDPFVGTWVPASASDNWVVISRHGDDYLLIAYKPAAGTMRGIFVRHDNQLIDCTVPPGETVKPRAQLTTGSSRLYFAPFGVNEMLTRVSDSTTVPTPPPTAVSRAGSSTTTYTNAAFHFAISYDARKLAAHINQSIPSPEQWLFPGAGHVSGPTQVLDIIMKSPASLPVADRGAVELTAVGPVRRLHAPTLAAFSHESYLRSLEKEGQITGRPQAVKLNGRPAFLYSMVITPGDFEVKGASLSPAPGPSYESVTNANYVVYHGGFVYVITLEAPTPSWPSVEPTLNRVAQTFTVTP
jgi:hypothetical protein